MATSPLIACPKKVTQDVDWAVHIRAIIATTYGESPDSYSSECAALNRCRQDALRGSAGSDVTARDLLYKYFGQLELLELRFPEIRVPFPWSDAFTSKQISQLSLAYEKASVIFNIAATLSSLSAAQNRSSPEGLKRAFNGFRAAAGMFQYINDNFLHAPSTDLSKEVVKNLVVLMSAQATEVFLERMIEERKGPGIKARVCAQLASQYHSLQEEIKDFVVKGWFSRAWSMLIQCKAALFTSLAQYNKSLADASASKHGDALARLKIAETNAREAQRLSGAFNTVFVAASVPTLPPDAATSLSEICKTQLTLCSEAKAAAQSDNDLVYHETVPSEAALSVVEKSVVAEPVPIQETYGTPEVQKVVGPDIFARLVPLSVHESASMYSEEKAKVVRAQSEACDLADGEMRAALEYMGLPASLAKFRGTSSENTLDALADPGPQVVGWSEAVRSAEAERAVQNYLDSLENLKAKARADLDAAEQDLNNEQRDCEQARVRYLSFEQAPSASLTRHWRQSLKSHRESLEQASVSDGRNLAEWQAVRSELGLLTSSDNLERAFAEAVASSGSDEPNLLDADLGEDEGDDLKKRVAAIEEAIGRLNKIKRERTEALKDLKERVQSDDISQLLILNRKQTNVEPQLFAAELEKFRGHQTRIGSSIHHQQLALQEIGTQYKALTEGKAARDIQNKWARAEKRRRDLSARLQQAHDGYFDVRGTLEKGSIFYSSLGELAASLRSEVSRFAANRASERSAMLSHAELDNRLSSRSSTSPSVDQQFASLDLLDSRPPYPAPSPAAAPSYAAPSVASPPPRPQPPYVPTSTPYSGPIAASPAPHVPAREASYPSYAHQPSNGYTSPPPSSVSSTSRLPPPPAPYNATSGGYRPAPVPSASQYGPAPSPYAQAPSPYSQPSYGHATAPPVPSKPNVPVPYGHAPPHQQAPIPYGQQPSTPQSHYGAPPPAPQQYQYSQQPQQQYRPSY